MRNQGLATIPHRKDDAITHNDRKNPLVIDERKDLAGDVEVVVHVAARFDLQSCISVGSAPRTARCRRLLCGLG
jgi:hypothetical protein